MLDEHFGVNPFKTLLQIAQLLPEPIRKRLPWLDLASPTEKIIQYIESLVSEHRQNYNPGHLNDIIDAFFDKQDKYKSGLYTDSRETYESFTEDQLVYLPLDFFLAGTETTATTLNWAVLNMLRYPDVQKKDQEELDQAYSRGSNVVPTLRDKAKLTFTSATLMEIQRIRPVAPLTTPHCAVRNSKLSGYSIWKGSTVINDLWSVHMDEKFWEQPDKFDPNRMLDANNEVIRPVSFLPFSIGPRACLGEQLAKAELFIFFTTCCTDTSLLFRQESVPPLMSPILVYR
ncbi:cytochrome P450 2U1-like [Ptychodera flava]|uniref:cytochrome P450 2U1-like n=1 Tax=Ptychodera flava TaxID=63121 RepID=UPI00396A49A0